MCLALPGRVLERFERAGGLPFARVEFGAIAREVCLAYTPEAAVGDYVIVHVGFAISRVDEAEARRTFEALREMSQLDELEWMRATADAALDTLGEDPT
ncbi:MAG: HypC/HybG/HupF family hydrogenase formation chaperone [Gemmatimonadetes bacterium]|nr:HypC/HybG/HupF family hydrogenase formation chaperone [Gemmatimonadota bacterium]